MSIHFHLRQLILLSCLSILIVFFAAGCQQKAYYSQLPDRSAPVVITGKILNYERGISRDFAVFYIDDFLTGDNRALNIPISDSGEFKILFTATLANTPALSYYSIIPCFIHPGDSLHVELDATDTIPNQPGYVRFSGDRSKENEVLQAYSLLKISHIEKETKKFAMQDSLNLRDWILYVQRFGEERNKETADFLAKTNPPSEIVDWIHDQEKSMYYFDIKSYRHSAKIENNEEEHFDLLEKFLDVPPLEKNQLSSPYARTVVNILLEKHRPNQNRWKGKLGDFIRSMDSTTLANILAEPVNLTQQLVLATFGHNLLEAGNMTFFENHLSVFNEALKEPLLLEALEKKYADIKDGIYTPYSQREKKDSPSQIVDGQLQTQTGRNLPVNITEISKGTILDTVIQQCKAKVLYVDLWSIECGVSLKYLPSIEQFRLQYEENELECIYLCLDSQEWHWKNQINKHELKGQHFLLNPTQAHRLKEKLNLTGAPFYLIIDKVGTLHQEGPELWPENPIVKSMIDSLLHLNILN